MADPTSDDRVMLDRCIYNLSTLSEDLTLDNFRADAITEGARASEAVKRFIERTGIGFLILTMLLLVLQGAVHKVTTSSWPAMVSAALWSFYLGGLGSVAAIFLHVLKLVPQQALNAADEFEVRGRVLLGCLFSMILSITVTSKVFDFFVQLESGRDNIDGGILALLPFLLGYSIPLVLRLLEKFIQAVELTLGAEDKRSSAGGMASGRRGKP